MPKMKICKYCRSEINKKASVCPYCHRNQPHGCLFNLIAVGSLFFIFYVTGSILMDMTDDEDYSKNNEYIDNVEYSTVVEETEQEYKATCNTTSYEAIRRDKSYMKGERLTFTGKITQIQGDTYLFNVTKVNNSYQDSVVFTYSKDKLSENLLAGDIVVIWGESDGMYHDVYNLYGRENTVPIIKAKYLERLQ